MNASAAPLRGASVEVRGLAKSFGLVQVFRDVNLQVRASEIFVIMGPSGSGKSVLLRHIIGLEHPDAGEILINGEPLEAPGMRERCRMAMVFQSGALLNSLTVGQNVGLYLKEHRLKPPAEIAKIVSAKLNLVGLGGLENRQPSELSGGMKKRVAIARALVIDPQLVLFDEPTSELDPLSAVTVAEEIVRLRDVTGATAIVITHDRDLAFEVGDRVAMMYEGSILTIGDPQELRRSTLPIVQRFLSAGAKTLKE